MAIHPLVASKTDYELRFCIEVLKLQSLHLGYCPDHTTKLSSLEELSQAQTNYTNYLIRQIPNSVTTVLDVGCGMCDVALAIEDQRQIAVTSISPEADHKRYFRNTMPGSRFLQTKFEDFLVRDTYDLVLLSESNNYFDAKFGLTRAHDLLAERGALLVCGFFKTADSNQINSNMVYLDEYVTLAERSGFELTMHEDISKNIEPAIEYAETLFNGYMLPILRLAHDFFHESSALLRFATRHLLSKPDELISRLESWYGANLSLPFFRSHLTYRTLLLRKHR